MIKRLKLKKAVYLILLGILTFLAAQLLKAQNMRGADFLLGVSGACFILGALLFLYPILFAKKIGHDGKNVELQPIEEEEDPSE